MEDEIENQSRWKRVDGLLGYYRIVDERGNIRKEHCPNIGIDLHYDTEGHPHRLDGPAKEYGLSKLGTESKEWWYHGTKLNCTSRQEYERLLKLKLFW